MRSGESMRFRTHGCLGLAIVVAAYAAATRLDAIASSGPQAPSGIATHAPSVALADSTEPGERLLFSGRVLDDAGYPLSGAAVVAYQADRTGRYNPPGAGTRVPRLRGTAVTDTAGEFSFSTVRPGAYPEGNEPAHLHLEITAPAHPVRHVTFWFADDPLVTPAQRRRADRDAEIVIVQLLHGPSGEWTFRYDIALDVD